MSDNERQLFENLALAHMDSLYSRAVRLTKSAEAAEGLVQQTYVSVFNAFDQFDKKSDYDKWQIEILMLFFMSSRNYLQESADK